MEFAYDLQLTNLEFTNKNSNNKTLKFNKPIINNKIGTNYKLPVITLTLITNIILTL